MSISSKFKEYIWLVNTIHKAGQITLSEIQEKWLTTDMSEGIELSRTTFSRHKDAIEDIFGIYIECDRKMDTNIILATIEFYKKIAYKIGCYPPYL